MHDGTFVAGLAMHCGIQLVDCTVNTNVQSGFGHCYTAVGAIGHGPCPSEGLVASHLQVLNSTINEGLHFFFCLILIHSSLGVPLQLRPSTCNFLFRFVKKKKKIRKRGKRRREMTPELCKGCILVDCARQSFWRCEYHWSGEPGEQLKSDRCFPDSPELNPPGQMLNCRKIKDLFLILYVCLRCCCCDLWRACVLLASCFRCTFAYSQSSSFAQEAAAAKKTNKQKKPRLVSESLQTESAFSKSTCRPAPCNPITARPVSWSLGGGRVKQDVAKVMGASTEAAGGCKMSVVHFWMTGRARAKWAGGGY